VTLHGTSNSPAQSGEKHTQHPISNQASIEVQPGQSSASQSNIPTQTAVSQQHSLEIPSDSADTQQSDSRPETGILCCRY